MGAARVALSLGGKRRSQGRRGGGSAVQSILRDVFFTASINQHY